MEISGWVWAATLVGLVALLLVDLLVIGRRPHEPSMRESTLWVLLYIGLAVIFGLGILAFSGARYSGEFFAGWITEYSLSIDNLFIFAVIMSRFAVPREYQQKVLMIGIVLALVMRGAFIAAGAAAINKFVWIFYFFGIFLIYTAIQLVRHGEDENDDFRENILVRLVRRIVPMSTNYDRANIQTIVDGRRVFTPMLIVLVAIGTTDLLFALDSIPAIFGLTQESYLVFTANVFALMGLRQLYFLLGGLLKRLIYLSVGLAVILGFIGVKLILDALHENNVPFLNGGEPISWAPKIPIWISLLVIVGTLIITAAASLLKSGKNSEKVP